MSLPKYTKADLVHWFGEREVQKAQAYVPKYRDLQVNDGVLTASVKGTAARPYRQSVFFLAENRLPYSQCSCPLGGNCKHVVGALLAALERPGLVSTASRSDRQVLEWLDTLRTQSEEKKPGKAPTHALVYLIAPDGRGGMNVNLHKVRVSHVGGEMVLRGDPERWDNIQAALARPPSFVGDEDLRILRLLSMEPASGRFGEYHFPAGSAGAEALLERLIATGRCMLGFPEPLHVGASRPGRLVWVEEPSIGVYPSLLSEPACDGYCVFENPWYLDGERREMGPVDSDISAAMWRRLAACPPLSEEHLPLVAQVLGEVLPGRPLPAPAEEPTVVDGPFRPLLHLYMCELSSPVYWHGYPLNTRRIEVAELAFLYGEYLIDPLDKRETFRAEDGGWVRFNRDSEAEARALAQLKKVGLLPMPLETDDYFGRTLLHRTHLNPSERVVTFGMEAQGKWPDFVERARPLLENEGWVIDIDPEFAHQPLLEVEQWDARVEEGEDGWFSLDMGVMVEGERLALAPLLHGLFNTDPRWLDKGRLNRIPNAERIALRLPDGRQLGVPAERIKPLARTLIDLFDRPPGDSLRLSRFDAPRLDALARGQDWALSGHERLMSLARALGDRGAVHRMKPPKSFQGSLRPYQQQGLGWMQFLREQNLGGILADDMGLGKTAQTLAHLETERVAGRLDKPVLVILPTSLVFNWKREAARFAPELRVLSLHGPERSQHFSRIAEQDVVLSTYPLLPRDRETLIAQSWSWLILDEAQTVKNIKSQGAQIIRELDARHRLCLTGTPMENHLGELWTQMDFLLPGFLGDEKSFQKAFRRPIEKEGDQGRAQLLSRRIAPFILRRRKEDVASELPPKTEIVRRVELTGKQRDLYETVRSAMDEKVRQAIGEKGFARSQIVILDALLKLRQVCCHPALLKIDAAAKVKESAKLDLLMDMLPELVDEGRRILVFSAFTGMLDTIAVELDKRKIAHVRLSGETRDRESVVSRFQDGDVPVFLISLKAGGVGLNLTAADTVIHYDPWWNPAAEDQATDRAHRIGQTRQVFVYKLIAEGSIEEKILALQEKKAALAEGVLGEDGAALSKFDEAEVRALLAPLPA
ncbi:MAG: DEAD/DEAH box helicase [Pseudomonadota bacterium]